MRSVNRGLWPTDNDGCRISFSRYSDAKRYLIERIGKYCSYCERCTDLDLEHVIPQSVAPHLVKEWCNFLLACINCNRCKSNKNNSRDGYLWPDHDDTFGAFVYQRDGRMSVKAGLVDVEYCKKASALFDLVGLGRQNTSTNERNRLRREAWGTAAWARDRAHDDNSRQLVVRLALATGFFSVWMAVFHDDEDMRQRLTEAFPGTRPG